MFQVNVLTHVTNVTLKPEHLHSIKELKAKHLAQDQEEIYGAVTDTNIVDGDGGKFSNDPCSTTENGKEHAYDVDHQNNNAVLKDASSSNRGDEDEGDRRNLNEPGTVPDESVEIDLAEGTSSEEKISEEMESWEASDGGALWDIFRRQDVPQLQEYLNKHFREFRYIHAGTVPQVSTIVNWTYRTVIDIKAAQHFRFFIISVFFGLNYLSVYATLLGLLFIPV